MHATTMPLLPLSFRVNQNGTLTMVDTAGGLPLGAQGIAAK
jgi:hypothetical protein